MKSIFYKSIILLHIYELVDHPAADLLQRELAHIVEEELEGGEQGHEEDHDGDEEGNCNQH